MYIFCYTKMVRRPCRSARVSDHDRQPKGHADAIIGNAQDHLLNTSALEMPNRESHEQWE
jgi:hypothetical protein